MWQLALVTLAMGPLIAIIYDIYTVTLGKLSAKSQDTLSTAGNITDQFCRPSIYYRNKSSWSIRGERKLRERLNLATMSTLGLRYFSDRASDGDGQPRLDAEDGEELMHVESSVSISLDNRPREFSGTLYITTKKVVWLSDTDKGKGYAVDFLALSLHAVSRDPETYPLPCIYAQIENEDVAEDESGGSDVENNEDLGLASVTEMRLVPSDPNQLDALFNIFCQCAELNPDPNQEHDEDSEWIFGDEQMADEDDPDYESETHANPIGCCNGDNDLSHSMVELEINDQRFEDAEEISPEERTEHR